MQTILALIVPQSALPHLEYIPATLDEYQAIVGGCIEPVAINCAEAIGLCNDSFLLFNVPSLNRSVNKLRAPGVGEICGDCFIVGDTDTPDGREFCSLEIWQVAMLEDKLNISLDVPRAP